MSKIRTRLPKGRRVNISSDDEEGIKRQRCNALAGQNCLYCGKWLANIRQHIRKNHKETAIRCELKKCSTYFLTLEQRNEHVNEVHGKVVLDVNAGVFPCIFCKKTFLRRKDRKQHIERRHSDMAFQCSNFLCVAVFTSQAELDAHYQANHAKADSLKSFQCDKCEFRCNNWNNLDRHVRHMHEEKTVRCFVCSKMFPSERAMSTHVNDSHLTKHCRFCDLRVPVIERSRHQQAVRCERCDRSFPCAGTNDMHSRYCAPLPIIKTETPEIPQKDPSDDDDDDDDGSQFVICFKEEPLDDEYEVSD
ncbi:transcriptional repressor CTCF-like [Cloeon dipterum]|uniref:transcriptional repressor CTCF-like n=1 Tax=Cloeon dipterum TaxID=197152 RepID=UPI0032207EBD